SAKKRFWEEAAQTSKDEYGADKIRHRPTNGPPPIEDLGSLSVHLDQGSPRPLRRTRLDPGERDRGPDPPPGKPRLPGPFNPTAERHLRPKTYRGGRRLSGNRPEKRPQRPVGVPHNRRDLRENLRKWPLHFPGKGDGYPADPRRVFGVEG